MKPSSTRAKRLPGPVGDAGLQQHQHLVERDLHHPLQPAFQLLGLIGQDQRRAGQQARVMPDVVQVASVQAQVGQHTGLQLRGRAQPEQEGVLGAPGHLAQVEQRGMALAQADAGGEGSGMAARPPGIQATVVQPGRQQHAPALPAAGPSGRGAGH
jgi:hypothetical protein